MDRFISGTSSVFFLSILEQSVQYLYQVCDSFGVAMVLKYSSEQLLKICHKTAKRVTNVAYNELKALQISSKLPTHGGLKHTWKPTCISVKISDRPDWRKYDSARQNELLKHLTPVPKENLINYEY